MATKKKTAKKAAPDPEEDQSAYAQISLDAWANAIQVGDAESMNYLKILLFGANGAGKTNAAARFRRPLIGCTEPQGIPSYIKANPSAIIYRTPSGSPVIKTVGDLKRFCLMAREASDNDCDAVILDSLTDAQRIILKHFTMRQSDTSSASQKSWGLSHELLQSFVRKLRDIEGVHVLITCLSDEIEQDGTIIFRPGLSGKRIGKEIGQFVNVVGYSHKRMTEQGVRYQVMFDGSSDYAVKTIGGLDNIEPPEPLLWAHKVFGADLPEDVAIRVRKWHQMEEEAEDNFGSDVLENDESDEYED